MRISRVELKRLVEEELAEFFERKKDYPADAMAEWAAVLFSTAKQNGIPTAGDQRQKIIGEFERALEEAGYKIAEQKLELGDDISLKVSKDAMPFTYDLISSIGAKNPDALKGLPLLFKRGAINLDLSDVASAEDLVATTRTKPVAPPAKPKAAAPRSTTPPAEPDEDPEDQKATDKVTAVARPGQEEPAEEDTPLKAGDIVRVTEGNTLIAHTGDYKVDELGPGPDGEILLAVMRPLDEETGEFLDAALAAKLFPAIAGTDTAGYVAVPVKDIAKYPDFFQVNPETEESEEEEPTEVTPEDAAAGVEAIKQKVLGMFSFDKDNLDNVDLLLTAGAIIPGGIGCIVGAVNAVFNFSRGEWLWGTFDTVFAVPPICGSGAGEVASGLKGIFKALGKVAAKLGGKSPKVLAKAAKQAAKAGKTLGKAEKAALKEFDKVVKTTEKGLAKVIGEEAAAKYTGKYVTKLLGAIKSKKTKDQIAAVTALLPDSFFENMDEVLNKPVKDIWGTEIIAKMDKLLEKVGVDLVGEKYEKLLDGAQVDMILFLANKAGILSDDDYPAMTETIGEIRENANADASLTKEQRIEKFIADASDDEEAAAAPSPRPRFGQSGKKMRPTPGLGPPIAEELLREQKELDRMKVLAGVK